MSYHPKVYGDANGVTKTSIQLTSRPGAWENFVASGNLRTQDVYDSEEGIRARYAAAVAAAGEHDIVTLTAQTDGTSAVTYAEHVVESAVSPTIGGFGVKPVRGVLLDMRVVFLPPTSWVMLDGDMTGTWHWFALSSSDMDSHLSLISTVVAENAGIPIPSLPDSGWVLLTKGSGSTMADIPADAEVQLMCAVPSAVGYGTRSLIAGETIVDAPLVSTTASGGNTLSSVSHVSVPLPASVAGQRLLSLSIPRLAHSTSCTVIARSAQGINLASMGGELDDGVLSTSLLLPSAAVELLIVLASPWTPVLLDAPHVGYAAATSPSNPPAGYLAAGTASALYRWADAQSLSWTYRETQGTPVPCYTGTITITTYTRDPNNLVPAQAGIYDVDYSTTVETHNPQENWTDIQRAAWSAVIAGQRLFSYAGRTYNAWATCPANPFSNYPDQERRVGQCTVTWADKVDNPKEEPPSSTHTGYTHYRGGGQKRLTGYAETWYLHTATYADK